MSKTALVTGATGFLGRQVLRAFQSAGYLTVGTGHSRASPPAIRKVDLTDEAAVTSLVDEVNPDVVVHCAANRFPDKVDQNPDAASQINVRATEYLVRACSSKSSFLIYISTDYVFPGIPGEADTTLVCDITSVVLSPYESTATPRPTNMYGQTKLDGENVILSTLKGGSPVRAIVLRVPVLYGPAASPNESAVNILLDVVWKSQEQGARIDMDHWARRFPTNTEDVARYAAFAIVPNTKDDVHHGVCLDLSKKFLDEQASSFDSDKAIFQFSSEDCFTKYEMCKVFAEIMGLPITGIKANDKGNEVGAKVQRPFDTHLSTRALKELGIETHTQDFLGFWRRELGAYRK